MANNPGIKVISRRAKQESYPLLKPKERVLIWEKARGMWKNRKPDPLQELRRIRKEWERSLSSK